MSATNSTTADRTASGPASDRTPAKKVFSKAIQQDSQICSRCFRRKYIAVPVLVSADGRDRHDPETRTGYVDTVNGEAGTATEAFLRFEPSAEIDVCFPPPAGDSQMPAADRRACPRARTVCDCGAVDADASRSTLSKSVAIEHAERISDRLDEQDITHDRALLLAVVKKAKSDPETAGRDEKIFTTAVAGALSRETVSVESPESAMLALVE